MSWLKSLALAFSCFSRVPMPRVAWDEENMRFMMAWFPLVGAVVGALVAAWCALCEATGIGPVLRAVGIAAVPALATGGFHLDGFADVVDAQASHADPSRKREILKDPHIGAFAALGLVLYELAYFGLACELPFGWRVAACLACVHVVTRSCSAVASTAFPGARAGGMLSALRHGASRKATLASAAAFAALALGGMAFASAAAALACALMAACMLAWVRGFSRKSFGGMSGDVVGFFLQSLELALVACLVIVAKAVGL